MHDVVPCVVDDEGNEHTLENIESLVINADIRTKSFYAQLVVVGPELLLCVDDVETSESKHTVRLKPLSPATDGES